MMSGEKGGAGGAFRRRQVEPPPVLCRRAGVHSPGAAFPRDPKGRRDGVDGETLTEMDSSVPDSSEKLSLPQTVTLQEREGVGCLRLS